MTREEFLAKIRERREQHTPQVARFREAIERLRARKAAAEVEAEVTAAESTETNSEK